MKMKNIVLFLVAIIISCVFFGIKPVHAADTFCFCYDDPAKITGTNYKTAEADFLSTGDLFCADVSKVPECNPEKVSRKGVKKYDACSPAEKLQDSISCKFQFETWTKDKASRIQSGQKLGETIDVGVGMGIFLPACVNTVEGCRDIGVFVEMGINIADYLFGIVGALALLMFIYGGIMMVVSGGNPERVKKGTDILVTAVIGLIIVFGAYALIKFVGGSLVKTEYTLQ